MITQRISNVGHNTAYLIKITLKIAVPARSLNKVKLGNSAPNIIFYYIIIIMESDTADSDSDVSNYSYSVDELYEAVENSSKLVTRQTTVKKTISNTTSLNLNETNELDCYVLNDCNSEINIYNIETFEFNETMLNNDNMKIIPNYENEIESVTNHNIIADIIQDDDTNKFSLEHNNNIIQNNKDINVSVEENDTISQSIGRKRSKKANSDAWSRNDAKIKRMRGEAYLGYRRKEKQSTLNIMHDTPREERQMGPPCQSKICKQWKTRFILHFYA